MEYKVIVFTSNLNIIQKKAIIIKFVHHQSVWFNVNFIPIPRGYLKVAFEFDLVRGVLSIMLEKFFIVRDSAVKSYLIGIAIDNTAQWCIAASFPVSHMQFLSQKCKQRVILRLHLPKSFLGVNVKEVEVRMFIFFKVNVSLVFA